VAVVRLGVGAGLAARSRSRRSAGAGCGIGTDHPMLDVSVFRNLRFSAASISIACVFFALMGVMYVLTMYVQSVLGYSPLQAGVKMLPIAIGMVLASKLAIGLTRRLGTKFSVTFGLANIAGAMAQIATFDTDTTSLQIALALGALGLGMIASVAGDIAKPIRAVASSMPAP
jgi:Na+/melibiose symporter-like transporter